MSIEMTIGGKPVNPRDIVMSSGDAGGFGATGSFEVAGSITINAGDTILVGDSSGTFKGIVTSYAKTNTVGGRSTTSGTFVSPSTWASARRIQQIVSHADQRIIDEFVIESMARGFAENGID